PPATSTLPESSSVAEWPSRPFAIAAAADQLLFAGSYSSAVAKDVTPGPVWLMPPATRTLPEGSSVAVWRKRGLASEPADAHVLVAGSYNSARAMEAAVSISPPTISTFPEGNNVAVGFRDAFASEPPADQLSVDGSYNSALARMPTF